jgi:RNA polymerase sigma-70 factor (ECF subfamily)
MASPLEDLLATRRSLITRLKNWDDQEGWQRFFDTYWRLIFSFARRAGLGEDEAQEVVQETILAVARQMPTFTYDEKRSFKNWLLHTTRWRIADQFRKRQRGPQPADRGRPADHTRTPTIERIPDPAEPDLDAAWETEWQTHTLQSALERVKERVNPRQYQIFDLYVLRNWPVGQVAKSLGVNVGQIYLAKHRVTTLLKKEVRQVQHGAP